MFLYIIFHWIINDDFLTSKAKNSESKDLIRELNQIQNFLNDLCGNVDSYRCRNQEFENRKQEFEYQSQENQRFIEKSERFAAI